MMAKSSSKAAHQDVIQRLMDAEKKARDQVKKAEDEAEEIIESAGREAEEQVRQAEESAKSEAEEIVSNAREESEKRTGGRGAGVGDIDGLRQHAEENMDAAVQFLVDRVTERGEQG